MPGDCIDCEVLFGNTWLPFTASPHAPPGDIAHILYEQIARLPVTVEPVDEAAAANVWRETAAVSGYQLEAWAMANGHAATLEAYCQAVPEFDHYLKRAPRIRLQNPLTAGFLDYLGLWGTDADAAFRQMQQVPE